MRQQHRAPIALAVVATLTVAIDQFTKWWALTALEPGGERVPILGELLGLRLVFNAGAALSLGSSRTWILTIASFAVCVGIIVYARKVGNRAWGWALGLLLGGALGNLLDRLLREPGFGRGHVVDFIDYQVFVGNVADIALVLAAGLVILLNVRGVRMRPAASTDEPAPGGQVDGQSEPEDQAEASEHSTGTDSTSTHTAER